MSLQVYKSCVAGSIPFDNSTNGFTATTVQAAVEEARNTVQNYYVSGTSTVTSSSATYTLITGMTVTPAAGTYMVVFTGTFRIASNNADGDFAVYSGGSIVADSNRHNFTTVSLLLGLINVSVSASGQCSTKITVNGSQAVEARFRASTGTIAIDERSMILMRIA